MTDAQAPKVAGGSPGRKKITEPLLDDTVGQVGYGKAEIEYSIYENAFNEGWRAALKEVESQWSHGTDGLARFLATQKRLA